MRLFHPQRTGRIGPVLGSFLTTVIIILRRPIPRPRPTKPHRESENADPCFCRAFMPIRRIGVTFLVAHVRSKSFNEYNEYTIHHPPSSMPIETRLKRRPVNSTLFGRETSPCRQKYISSRETGRALCRNYEIGHSACPWSAHLSTAMP